MTGAITTVILPGLGAVCPECFCRGFISGGLPIDGCEIYTFSMTGPESELSWDIARAQELLAQRPRKPTKLDPVELADWLRTRVTITPLHLDHIPVEKRGLPGVFVVITVAARPDAPMFDFGILIDGSHRAALALRDGRDFYAYLLTEQEQRSICTYTVEGRFNRDPPDSSRSWNHAGGRRAVTVRPSTAEDRCAARGLNDVEPVDKRERTPRAFEVTVLTTRSGTTAVVITAFDQEAAVSAVRELLATGECTAPPEHCTDDIQTEIWTIREVQ